jgi:hypothetical protein
VTAILERRLDQFGAPGAATPQGARGVDAVAVRAFASRWKAMRGSGAGENAGAKASRVDARSLFTGFARLRPKSAVGR